LAPLREMLPRIRYCLAGLQQLESRLEEGGQPWEELTSGLPFGAAQRLSQAIAREVAGSDTWDECFTPSAVAKLLDAGRAHAKKLAAEKAERDAAAQAEFEHKLAEFQAGRGADPRIVGLRIRALG
jgi:hypothetical protein